MANDLDPIFQALSDPTRRAVVERLVEGPAPVTELAKPHDMALPSFLKHLTVLEKVGVVASEKVGRRRIVRLKIEALMPVETWIDRQRRIWERRLDRLSAVAEELERTTKDEES
jgi:DNA-binding transcriptional ArsR family regulator